MKILYSKAVAVTFFMTAMLSQNASAQCAVTTGPTNDCSYGDAIDNFTIGTTTANNPGCTSGSGYSILTTPVFTFDADVIYPLSAAVGGNTYTQGMAIWIDLNNNGTYETTEQVWASGAASLNFTSTISVASTFPGLVINTPLPMRVMCVYNEVIPAENACTNNQNTYGETEDYTAIITSSVLPSNVEATAVLEPFDGDCGNISDSVNVTITNLTVTDEVDVPVELHLTGAVTGSYFDTIPSLLGNTSVDLTMAVINTEAGGTLNAQLIVSLGDNDANDDTLNVTINILDATALSITGSSTVCEGDSLDLSINNPTGAEVYTWYLDGASITTGTNINTGALLAAGQINVESSNGCRANDTLDVTVTLQPTASFTSSVNVGTVDFTGTATNETSISWDFGDGNASTSSNPQHTYAANGSYEVCFTATNSCGSVTSCATVIVSTIGVDELFLGGNVEVYPNPTHDQVNINFNGSDVFSGNWTLYDMDGKVLQTKAVSGTSELNISLGNYPVGAYILEMKSDSGETFRKELLRN